MVNTADRHAPPDVCPARREYRSPKLTVYGSVRDLTRGSGIGAPDNGVTPGHQMPFPGNGNGPNRS